MKNKSVCKKMTAAIFAFVVAVAIVFAIHAQNKQNSALYAYAEETTTPAIDSSTLVACSVCGGNNKALDVYNSGFSAGFAETTGTGIVSVGVCRVCGLKYNGSNTDLSNYGVSDPTSISTYPYFMQGYNAGVAAAANFTASGGSSGSGSDEELPVNTPSKVIHSLSDMYEDEVSDLSGGIYRIKSDAVYPDITIQSPISFTWRYAGNVYFGGALYVTSNGIAMRYYARSNYNCKCYDQGILECFTESDMNPAGAWAGATQRTLYVSMCQVNKSFYDWFIANTDYKPLSEVFDTVSENPDKSLHSCHVCGYVMEFSDVESNGYEVGYAETIGLPAVAVGKCPQCQYSYNTENAVIPAYEQGYIAGVTAGTVYNNGYAASEDEHANDYDNGYADGVSSVNTDSYYSQGVADGEEKHKDDYQNGYTVGYADGSKTASKISGIEKLSLRKKILYGAVGIGGLAVLIFAVCGLCKRPSKKRKAQGRK